MENCGYKNNYKFRAFFLGESMDNKNGNGLNECEIVQAVSYSFKNGYDEFYEDLRSLYNTTRKGAYCHVSTIAKIVSVISRNLEKKADELKKILEAIEKKKEGYSVISIVANDHRFTEIYELSKEMSSLLEEIRKLKNECKYYTS